MNYRKLLMDCIRIAHMLHRPGSASQTYWQSLTSWAWCGPDEERSDV